ncbi:hypothetical protein DDE18_09975 [Nocardioides gansuensis]|uniref:DUF4439 domain-containing protein n=2 Tax=Nocardioides gansuensis TaxID=2138300 RepID=A0A2T8FAF1_9ACTN|nr:hypothetical protein DDE18_09975 [Nocardioides gansuensis]
MSRRTTLAAALFGPLVGSACDSPFGDRPAGAPGKSPGSAEVDPTLSGDEAVVASVLAALDRSMAIVEAVTDRHPRLARTFAPLATMQAAHAAVLLEARVAEDRAPVQPPAVPPRASAAEAAARRAARSYERVLRESLMVAESGALARALAAMAAGVGQHLAVLDATGAPG